MPSTTAIATGERTKAAPPYAEVCAPGGSGDGPGANGEEYAAAWAAVCNGTTRTGSASPAEPVRTSSSASTPPLRAGLHGPVTERGYTSDPPEFTPTLERVT